MFVCALLQLRSFSQRDVQAENVDALFQFSSPSADGRHLYYKPPLRGGEHRVGRAVNDAVFSHELRTQLVVVTRLWSSLLATPSRSIEERSPIPSSAPLATNFPTLQCH